MKRAILYIASVGPDSMLFVLVSG